MDSDHNLARKIELLSISAQHWPLIGFDLWLEIFKRSPIETLCRLRSVCTPWKSVISSPFFINLHRSFTSSAIPANLKPYFVVDSSINSYDLYRPQNPPAAEHLKRQVRFPFRFRDSGIYFPFQNKFAFVDVIQGVFCVYFSLNSSFDSIVLWNPKIHKYVALPRPPFHLQSSMADFAHIHDFSRNARFCSHGIGFGYDSCKNDFKVVRVWIPCYAIQSDCSPPPSFEVYSSELGLWRVATINIDLKSIFEIGSSRTGCFVNGAIHWSISRNTDPEIPDGDWQFSVLMFDCEREEFRTMELPKEFRTMPLMEVELLEYADMLAVLMSRDVEGCHVELWGMEEHGVSSTWKKLFTFSLNGFDLNQPSFEKLAPYGPKEWNELGDSDLMFDHVYSCRVYEESMYLMDDTKARSYGKEETVHV